MLKRKKNKKFNINITWPQQLILESTTNKRETKKKMNNKWPHIIFKSFESKRTNCDGKSKSIRWLKIPNEKEENFRRI